MSGLVVDADAHVNEDPFAWNDVADLHPRWLTAGKSGGKWVAEIGGQLYPTQEGPGCGVPIDSATNPACGQGRQISINDCVTWTPKASTYRCSTAG